MIGGKDVKPGFTFETDEYHIEWRWTKETCEEEGWTPEQWWASASGDFGIGLTYDHARKILTHVKRVHNGRDRGRKREYRIIKRTISETLVLW